MYQLCFHKKKKKQFRPPGGDFFRPPGTAETYLYFFSALECYNFKFSFTNIRKKYFAAKTFERYNEEKKIFLKLFKLPRDYYGSKREIWVNLIDPHQCAHWAANPFWPGKVVFFHKEHFHSHKVTPFEALRADSTFFWHEKVVLIFAHFQLLRKIARTFVNTLLQQKLFYSKRRPLFQEA